MPESELFHKLRALSTEQRNAGSTHIDDASIEEIVGIINAEDKTVPEAVCREAPYIVRAIELIVEVFRQGGRLIYVGAGTSGRLGILDAAECPPTFGTSPAMIQGLIAGGPAAVFKAREGAEDDPQNGVDALVEAGVTPGDIVCGIAASSRTPYVVGAIRYARALGCKTLFITTNPRSQLNLEVDVAICPEVGPEVIMGSTRMKSGTAQKMVLNLLTTASMIRLGKVYQNVMVDLQMTNQKLVERSRRIVMMIADVGYDVAESVLLEANGHVKTALVMLLADITLEEAQSRLERSRGFVGPAIKEK